MYLSYFTSNVVKPFEKVYIDSNEELILHSPYKILVVVKNKNLSDYSSEFFEAYEKQLTRIGLSINGTNFEDYFLYTEVAANDREIDYKKISLTRDEGTMLFYRKFKRQYVIAAEAHVPGVNCHMLKEHWTVSAVGIYFQGHLTQALHQFFRAILISGIGTYWDEAFFNHFDRETRRAAELERRRQGGSSVIEAASMRTSLGSFFKLFVLLLGFDIMVFFAEVMLSGRVQHKLNRFKLLFWFWKTIILKKIHFYS
jgi:hypothetical protein